MSWYPSESAPAGTGLQVGTLRAVIEHVNTEHFLETLLIAWTVGGHPDALAAELVALGRAGLQLRVQVGEEVVDVLVPWAGPVTTWTDLQAEMYALSAAAEEQWTATVGELPAGE